MRSGYLGLFLSLFLVVPAIAEPARSSLRVEAGVASPVGELGLVYARPLAVRVSLEAGVGLGLSGVQLAALAKYTIGHGPHRFAPGLGFSLGTGGAAINSGEEQDDMRAAVVMPWLDIVALGYEFHGTSGFLFTAAAGATLPLRSAHWDVIDLGDDLPRFSLVPSAHIGIGHTL